MTTVEDVRGDAAEEAAPRQRVTAAQIAARLGQHAPTFEQATVVEAPLRPLLVVAGAGSGKTETMAARVVWLVASGLVAPDRVLGLTFTRKAAGELADRVRVRLRQLRAAGGLPLLGDGGELGEPTVATYHSYAASIVADHGLRLGVEPGSRLLGEAASWQLAQQVVEGWGPELAEAGKAPSTVVEGLVALAAECAEHLVDPERLGRYLDRVMKATAALPKDDRGGDPSRPARSSPSGTALAALASRRLLVPLLVAYARRKRELEALDFGDQVALAARLARAVPEVGASERARFDVVLLDEYQDTSHAQLELLRHLFGGGHPVTAVGDPHQSIYGWRGASAGNLDRFSADFPVADGSAADVGWLSTSFRNDEAVLDVANVLAGPLHRASSVGVRPLAPRAQAAPGRVAVRWFSTVDDETAALADDLAARWHAEDEDVARGRPRSTMAVLCRKRSQLPDIESALRARGLPVEVVGLGGLLERAEVVDVVAVLQVLHDPGRGDALMRLLTGPRWRIGPRDLETLGEWARSSVARARRADEHVAGGPGAAGVPDSAVEQPGALDVAVEPDRVHEPEQPDRVRVPDEVNEPVEPDRAHEPDEPDRVDERSIVDALDALPPATWRGRHGRSFSLQGYARLRTLSQQLAHLRRRTGLPLPELVTEVERALLLDVELAAVPGVPPSAARAQLDAFTDVAAAFAESADRPTLGGFLSWLAAAAVRERGLPQAEEVEDTTLAADGVEPSRTAVQLLTVHAAKGLEWDVVAVPGMVEGTLPSVATSGGEDSSPGWLSGVSTLPYELRGDAGSLPVFRWRSATHLKDLDTAVREFKLACGAHEAAEERRLAYVAATRARHVLLLSGSWWQEGKTARRPSRFLLEVAAAFRGDPRVAVDGLDEDEIEAGPGEPANPRLVQPRRAVWPYDPLGGRRPAVEQAAQQVLAELDLLRPERGVRPRPAQADSRSGSEAGSRPSSQRAGVQRPAHAARSHPASPGPVVAVDAWSTEADRLLAEREAAGRPDRDVVLPAHLPASRFVQLVADPALLAEHIRRPMPTRPSPESRRGTAFHAWLEERFRAETLVDLGDLPGACDEDAAPDEELPRLQQAFLVSEWAHRSPLKVEVAVETPVAGVTLRGRIDAVFSRADGGYEVVDWKTGAPPTGSRAVSAAAQLAVYRLAWARLHHVPLERVRAAFFYASTGETVRPVDTLDEAGLEAVLTSLPQVPAPSEDDRPPPAGAARTRGRAADGRHESTRKPPQAPSAGQR